MAIENGLLNPNQVMARCIADTDFQNWLAEKGLLVRDADPKVPTNPTLLNPTTKIGRFRARLAETPGFLVPSAELAEISGTDITLVPFIGSNAKAMDAVKPTVIPCVGWTYGVTDLRLNRGAIPMIYRLWLNLGGPVPDQELALATYGMSDPTLIANVNRGMRRQLLDLPEMQTYLTYISSGIGRCIYTLRNEGLKMEDYMPLYLNTAFQDFLASDDLGLITRMVSPLHLDQIYPTRSTGKKLMEILDDNAGYVVPYQYLGQAIFADTDSQTKIIRMVKDVRTKLPDHVDIFTLENVGLAYGIERVALNKTKLKIMYELWRKNGSYVDMPYLIHRVMKKTSNWSARAITTSIREIREALADSEYQIVADGKGAGYSLQRRETTS